jgi:hypothetical protein
MYKCSLMMTTWKMREKLSSSFYFFSRILSFSTHEAKFNYYHTRATCLSFFVSGVFLFIFFVAIINLIFASQYFTYFCVFLSLVCTQRYYTELKRVREREGNYFEIYFFSKYPKSRSHLQTNLIFGCCAYEYATVFYRGPSST